MLKVYILKGLIQGLITKDWLQEGLNIRVNCNASFAPISMLIQNAE